MPLDPTGVSSAVGQGLDFLVKVMQANAEQQRYKDQVRQNLSEQKRRLSVGSQALSTETGAYNQGVDLAKTGYSDVAGNRVVYKPGIGWTYELTPTSQKLVGGDQEAQLRAQMLARQGGEDFQQARAKYLYGPRQSEGELQDLYTRLGMINREKGLKEGVNVYARQALRMNMGNSIPALLKAADEKYGQTLEEQILKGRLAGTQAYQTAEKFRTSQGQTDLANFFKAANSAPNSGIEASLGGLANAGRTGLGTAIGDTTGITNALKIMSGDTTGGNVNAPNMPNYNIAGLVSSIGNLFQPAPATSSEYPKVQDRLQPSNDPITGY